MLQASEDWFHGFEVRVVHGTRVYSFFLKPLPPHTNRMPVRDRRQDLQPDDGNQAQGQHES
jgi:hypothetical protein